MFEQDNETSYPPPPPPPLPTGRMTIRQRLASQATPTEDRAGWSFSLSFFLLGLINNVLYVVILSAALDLVDKQSTPKGVILIVNIFPALLVKIAWPYLIKGKIRYARRIIACSLLSFAGIIVVALSPSLGYRLSGIAVASFSSGLGEMTYLQLATVYGALDHLDLGAIAIGWFASGTGAAGLVGAGLWWLLRGLGVRAGLLICSFLPLCMAGTYFLVLPSLDTFASIFQAYDSLPVFDIEEDNNNDSDDDGESRGTPAIGSDHQGRAKSEDAVHLTRMEKLELAKPLVWKYMVPLFFVYLAEYIINTGVAPTLLFPVPSPKRNPILSMMIKSLRDYYPLWQLVYQTFVFISRSSLSIFKLPPLPRAMIPFPTLVQLCLLAVTTTEAYTNFLSSALGEASATWVVFAFISLEGLSGGTAYVNVFYRLGLDDDEDFLTGDDSDEFDSNRPFKSKERREMEREFRISSVGFADTLGILVAALVSTRVEPWLCAAQVASGRSLCKDL
ncbi:batten's disease protein Cln3 [Meredithblackwellia eburnea MCA 4105]